MEIEPVPKKMLYEKPGALTPIVFLVVAMFFNPLTASAALSIG